MKTKPILSGNLTKRFLMSLGTGQYVVSNIYEQTDSGSFEPCFREAISPPASRDEQWARIKEARANGRLCNVLQDEAEYEAYKQSLPARSSRDTSPKS